MNKTRKHQHSVNESRNPSPFQMLEHSGKIDVVPKERALTFAQAFGGVLAANYLSRGLTLAQAHIEFARDRPN